MLKVIFDIVNQMLQVPAQPPPLTQARFYFLNFLNGKPYWFRAIKIALAITTNMNISFHYKTPNSAR